MSSDEEVVFKKTVHKQLLSEINNITKLQHIKKPKRSEPTNKNDEFHLIKYQNYFEKKDIENNDKSKNKILSTQSIANIVRKTSKRKKICNQFQDVFKKPKVLKKPLDPVNAERVFRTVSYDNTKTKLSRWDAIVTKNKNSEQLRFPLHQEKNLLNEIKNKEDYKFSTFRFKTQIMKDIEEIQKECFPKFQQLNQDKTSFEVFSLKEIKEKRKELARLKLRKSNQITKKRLQGKIKSKKYHKIKKKDQIKKKLKDFEELKLKNPEAALKELENIEKQRIKERITLRHKNTGIWAKNAKIRANHDINAKKELEAQLSIGRELTEKYQHNESSDSDENNDKILASKNNIGNNPWISTDKTKMNALDDVFSGYKKFWEEKNTNKKTFQKLKHSYDSSDLHEFATKPVDLLNNKFDNDIKINKEVNEYNIKRDVIDVHFKNKNEEAQDEDFINDLFDKAEEKISNEIELKLEKFKPQLFKSYAEKKKIIDKKIKKKHLIYKNDSHYLEFEHRSKFKYVDEALIEKSNLIESSDIVTRPSKKILEEIKMIRQEKNELMRGIAKEIDPNVFLITKSKKNNLFEKIENISLDQNQIEGIQITKKITMKQAFENDDITSDFLDNANDESQNKKKSNIDNSLLPGWGLWSGEEINSLSKVSKNEAINRNKKDRVIVNTNVNDKLKTHLISAVPFPFTTVKDFEASMRFPIGKDFVPNLAYKKLTDSNIITKTGVVIEPMSEDYLLQSAPKQRMNKRREI